MAKDTDVIVIGAGLSGLNAALHLEEQGFKVQVLEGRGRIGGRLLTLDDLPGSPETGGGGIGAGFTRILNAMDKYGVSRVGTHVMTEMAKEITMLNIGGSHIQIDEWPDHPLNPFPAALRDKLPDEFQLGIYFEDNPLKATSDFLKPDYAKFDISVKEYLKSKGLSDEVIRLAADTNMNYGHESGVEDLSVLMWFQIISFFKENLVADFPGSPFAAKGGNQRLPEAMAEHLKGEVRLNSKVVAIKSEKDGVTVELSTGEKITAGRVVVTVPFSTLRDISIDAPLNSGQRTAIDELPYAKVTQIHYLIKKKFWEDDGLPPSIWSDGPTARLIAQRNNKSAPSEITSFLLLANDRNADKIDRLGPKDGSDHVLSSLKKIRPSTEGALELAKFCSWQLDPFSKGAYATWRPGQITSFGSSMSQPAGRIYFAGEHTAINTRGMEGAMESAERVCDEILKRS